MSDENKLMDEMTERLLSAIRPDDRVDVVVMSSINTAVKLLTASTKQTNVEALDVLISTMQLLKEDELRRKKDELS